jgi:hypothetical protein
MRDPGRDLRKGKRTPSRRAAWISVGARSVPIPCVIWDSSTTGARIAAPRARSLPPSFRLLFTKDEPGGQPCRIVWRRETKLGVRFVDEVDDDEAVASRPSLPPATTLSLGAKPSALELQALQFAIQSAKPQPRRFSLSSLAGAFAVLLGLCTIFLIVAGLESAPAWSQHVCSGAGTFCLHPELAGGSALVMIMVYLAGKGMER